MERTRFYDPPDRGFEREMRKRLDWFDRLREKRRGSDGG
jgi:putative ATPase